MKVVLQRVTRASVIVSGKTVGEINQGYLLLVGFEKGDSEMILDPMVEKIRKLKLFSDDEGRFAYSLGEVNGSILAVSQFTLAAELKKGRKPSFSRSMTPEAAENLYDLLVEKFRRTGIDTQMGVFGAMMRVSLENDGPVTLMIDSEVVFPSVKKML